MSSVAGITLLLAVALSAPAEGDPNPGATKAIVSAPHEVSRTLPAARECGTTTVTKMDGTTIQVPRQGRFTERCFTVTIVDGSGTILSRSPRCDPLVFIRCS